MLGLDEEAFHDSSRFGYVTTSVLDHATHAISEADLKFGLSLADTLSKTEQGNLSISPASLRTALTMLAEGATGDTYKIMETTLGFPADPQERHHYFRQVLATLNPERTPYPLRFANGMWVERSYNLKNDFKRTMEREYRASIQLTDFLSNSERELSRINHWVSEKTEGKITQLFSEGSLSRETALVLANALYFKAFWEEPFEPQYTQKQEFTRTNGEKVKVAMMRKGSVERSEHLPELQYVKQNWGQTVILPYQGGRLAKVVLLPRAGIKVNALESFLLNGQAKVFGEDEKTEKREFSRLEIPKHELTQSYDLKDPLVDLGWSSVFSESAQFEKIVGEQQTLKVDGIVHQTYFKTDEKGSEGAAGSGIEILCAGGGEKPIEFVADRPFLELVLDSLTGSILFLNRVEDPS